MHERKLITHSSHHLFVVHNTRTLDTESASISDGSLWLGLEIEAYFLLILLVFPDRA